jgi:arabinogalactan oligomer/maltooligosaccharide transport system substrate-binding protein
LADGEFKDANNLGIAVIPAGPEGKFGSPMGGHGFVISANTKNREAAYKLIQFVTSKENEAKFASANNLLPARKSAYDLDELKNNRIISDFKAVVEKATARPMIPEGGEIYTEFTPNYQAALAGKKTAQQAWDDVAAAWNKLLKK